MRLSTANLRKRFGIRSDIARHLIPELYQATDHQALKKTTQNRLTDRHRSGLKSVRKRLNLPDDLAGVEYALQTYYALVVAGITAHALTSSDNIPDLTHLNQAFFSGCGVNNFDPTPQFQHVDLEAIHSAPLTSAVRQFDTRNAPPDALKGLYHDIFPRRWRHRLGEHYTPDWMAALVLDRLNYDGHGQLLDPTCGSGTFLALALNRMPVDMPVAEKLNRIAGIDIHPLAVLGCKANILLALGELPHPVTLPVYQADVILNPPELGQFDMVAGNPPWINWEALSADYRQKTRQYWQSAGLFKHRGMDTILGKGKKDLSLLITQCALDTYLADDGRAGLVLTQSTVKSAGAGDAFRQFKSGDSPLKVLSVDDMSAVRTFTQAAARTIILSLQKGEPNAYPVPYTLWQSRDDSRTIQGDWSLSAVKRKTRRLKLVAEPIDHEKPTSPWITGRDKAIRAIHRLTGASDYTAHAGVYTGGSNGVYWLKILSENGKTARVRNVVDGGRKNVPDIIAEIESELIYPLIRGNDLQRWQAIPSSHILLVQDAASREGYDEDWFKSTYPMAYAYLQQFERLLSNRATYQRYFDDSAPFYTMFNVGPYSLKPYKVVWKGLGANQMQTAVLSPVDGRPVMTNQAVHPFIGFDDPDEAHYVTACMNSLPFNYAVVSHSQGGSRSFAQPGILKTLRIPRYEPDNTVHRRLSDLSYAAHERPADADDAAITRYAARLWGLTRAEITAVQRGLDELRAPAS